MKRLKYKDLIKRPVSVLDLLSSNKPKVVLTIKLKDNGSLKLSQNSSK